MSIFIRLFLKDSQNGIVINSDYITHTWNDNKGRCIIYCDVTKGLPSKYEVSYSPKELFELLYHVNNKFIRLTGPAFQDHHLFLLNTDYIVSLESNRDTGECILHCNPSTGLQASYEVDSKFDNLLEHLYSINEDMCLFD